MKIVAETAIVSSGTLPVGFLITNNLQEFFVHAVLFPDSSLILDHGVAYHVGLAFGDLQKFIN